MPNQELINKLRERAAVELDKGDPDNRAVGYLQEARMLIDENAVSTADNGGEHDAESDALVTPEASETDD